MYNDLKSKKEKIVIVGMGYVGFPLAYHFAKVGFSVIGFDISAKKIELYKSGIDPTNEIGSDKVKEVEIEYTSDAKKISEGKFIVVAVPTPVGEDNIPDLYPVEAATELIGSNMGKGSIVIYESTVYPGVTEEVCVPILEKSSGMKYLEDFNVGYSPERINPGDKVNTLETVVKIVSGDTKEVLDTVAKIYSEIVKAGVCRAASIKVAEAAKVVENTQRDVNIAVVNELSEIFERLGIDTTEVIEAAGTKWNFHKYNPGLVGGHCIGVDPYYLIHKSEEKGYTPKILKAARYMNDHVSERIANKIIELPAKQGIENPRILVLGLTFKENVPDIRNSKIYDVIKQLLDKQMVVDVMDPWADEQEVLHEYDINLLEDYENRHYDVVVVATAHDVYREMHPSDFEKLMGKTKILVDIKGIVNKDELSDDVIYWKM